VYTATQNAFSTLKLKHLKNTHKTKYFKVVK